MQELWDALGVAIPAIPKTSPWRRDSYLTIGPIFGPRVLIFSGR
jgi:hypothetical protein